MEYLYLAATLLFILGIEPPQRHQILVAARDPFERFFFVCHDGILYLFR